MAKNTDKKDSKTKKVETKPMHKHWPLMSAVAVAVLGLVAIGYLAFRSSTTNDTPDLDSQPDQEAASQIELRQMTIDNPEVVKYTDYVIQANNYWFEGDLDKAFENYSKANELEPGNAEILTAMGVIKRAAKDGQAAIDYFNQAKSAYGDSNPGTVEQLDEYIQLTQNGDYETEVDNGDNQTVPQ